MKKLLFLCFTLFLLFTNAASATSQKFTLQVNGESVRLIQTFPLDTTTNTRKVLENFNSKILKTSAASVSLEISQPVIIEEPPFTDFHSSPNKAFGVQLAGQLNVRLSRKLYRSQRDFQKSQEKIMEIFSYAGVGIIRDLQSYDTKRFIIESRTGTFNFTNVDFITEVAHHYDIEMIGRLTPHKGPPLRLPIGIPKDKDGYLHYISKTVERYDGDNDFGCELSPPDCYEINDDQFPKHHGQPKKWANKHRIHYWETLKEPEPGKRNRVGNDPGLSPEDSVRVLQASFNTIKSASSNAEVFFAGMGPFRHREYTEESYLEKMVSLGALNYVTFFGYDAYVKDLQEKGPYYRKLAQENGHLRALWVGQVGAPHKMGRLALPWGGSIVKQSEHIVHTYTKGLAQGNERIFWGEYLDTSKQEQKKSTTWSSTGLFYPGTWEFKPAYFTYKLMASVLNNFSSIEQVAENIYKFNFENRSSLYILWPQ